MSSNINKVYRYPSELQLKFPEGLSEIRFLSEIDGFNYLSVKQNEDNDITLPDEFEEAELPETFLKEARQEQYEKAESLRKNYQFENVIYNDIELSASQMARQNMLGVVLSGELDSSYYWKDIKENPQEFTMDDFKEILKIISNRDRKLYYIEAQVKKEIDAKLSPNSLQLFDADSSWKNHEEAYLKN